MQVQLVQHDERRDHHNELCDRAWTNDDAGRSLIREREPRDVHRRYGGDTDPERAAAKELSGPWRRARGGETETPEPEPKGGQRKGPKTARTAERPEGPKSPKPGKRTSRGGRHGGGRSGRESACCGDDALFWTRVDSRRSDLKRRLCAPTNPLECDCRADSRGQTQPGLEAHRPGPASINNCVRQLSTKPAFGRLWSRPALKAPPRRR